MQALDTFLRQATDSGTVPGAVVCVVSRGQVVWHRAYGAAALTPEYRPMQCDTFFLAQQVTVILCTNRVHPSRQASGITSLRPAVHNLIMRALGVATT